MMSVSEQESWSSKSETDAYDSDDSHQDRDFDVLEATRSSLSGLSIKRESKRRIVERPGNDMEVKEDVEIIGPKLDEKDQKSYEAIEELIKAGQVEKSKVEQCKVYLRKHGLRLTGNKGLLIQRIKEHLDIIDGSGEKKYPATSFVLNCKGDACTGDIVMFEQNVYEMFSIASRSATGPPCGTRIVAGRIVKESYGAAKQQHTFTIEVLWSKGEKPLPPLHPLLIKGRNLYRLRTMRQKWKDEGERKKILSEKHARGAVARTYREARVQQREMWKFSKSNRVSSKNDGKTKHKNGEEKSQCPSKAGKNFEREQVDKIENEQENCGKDCCFLPEIAPKGPMVFFNACISPEKLRQRHPLTNLNAPRSFHDGRLKYHDMRSTQRWHGDREDVVNHRSERDIYDGKVQSIAASIPRGRYGTSQDNNGDLEILPLERRAYGERNFSNEMRGPLRVQSYRQNVNTNSFRSSSKNFQSTILSSNPMMSPMWMPAYHGNAKVNIVGNHTRAQGHGQKLECRFYAQGRCYYGQECKYLHQ